MSGDGAEMVGVVLDGMIENMMGRCFMHLPQDAVRICWWRVGQLR